MASITKIPVDLPNMLSLPLKVSDHSKFSAIFFFLGFFLTCWFLLYVVTYKKGERKLIREVLLAVFASIYLGLGSFFLMLSFGVNL